MKKNMGVDKQHTTLQDDNESNPLKPKNSLYVLN